MGGAICGVKVDFMSYCFVDPCVKDSISPLKSMLSGDSISPLSQCSITLTCDSEISCLVLIPLCLSTYNYFRFPYLKFCNPFPSRFLTKPIALSITVICLI